LSRGINAETDDIFRVVSMHSVAIDLPVHEPVHAVDLSRMVTRCVENAVDVNS
jgi:hypothetical protein